MHLSMSLRAAPFLGLVLWAGCASNSAPPASAIEASSASPPAVLAREAVSANGHAPLRCDATGTVCAPEEAAARPVTVSDEAQRVALGQRLPEAPTARAPVSPPPVDVERCDPADSAVVRAHVERGPENGSRVVDGSVERALMPKCPEARLRLLDPAPVETYPPIARIFTALFALDW